MAVTGSAYWAYANGLLFLWAISCAGVGLSAWRLDDAYSAYNTCLENKGQKQPPSFDVCSKRLDTRTFLLGLALGFSIATFLDSTLFVPFLFRSGFLRCCPTLADTDWFGDSGWARPKQVAAASFLVSINTACVLLVEGFLQLDVCQRRYVECLLVSTITNTPNGCQAKLATCNATIPAAVISIGAVFFLVSGGLLLWFCSLWDDGLVTRPLSTKLEDYPQSSAGKASAALPNDAIGSGGGGRPTAEGTEWPAGTAEYTPVEVFDPILAPGPMPGPTAPR